MKRNILFFSYWYPNKSNPNFAIYVKRHAAAIKHSNNIIVLSVNIIKSNCIYKQNNAVLVDEHGIETHHIYLESRFNKLLYVLLPLHFFIIKQYINRNIKPHFQFDYIHSNILFPCAIIGNSLSNYFKCRHVITEHWSKIDHFFKTNIYKYFGKKTLDKAYAITSVSAHLADTIKKHTQNTHVSIIPNVINASQFYYDTNIEKNKTFTFIAVAHWSPPKNPFYFLEALQHIYTEKQLNTFKLVLVGNGSQIETIKRKNFNFEIEYKGNLSADELRTELNRSHVFLHGSDYETFSVIIAEALMCGLPSVVSPVGIAHDVINAQNGFVTTNTVADWQDKIIACANQSYNYSEIANHLKNKYDSVVIGNLFNSIYE